MLSRRPILGGTFAALLASLLGTARAEEPLYARTWSQEALAGVEVDPESPELRTLRIAEEELFVQQKLDADGAAAAAKRPLDEPPREFERDGKRIDVSFLKTLKLPTIPVRWDARVIEYLLFFKDDPRGRELAAGWLKRQERYGPMLRATLAEHELPEDLQYVAMVESGYDPRARSVVDAYGMWQFVQQPAEAYGLRIDHWVDERLDPERATRAAARFLRDLHDRFGTWELAFAAYNMGYGGLLRAIRKYNTNDYWLLSHLEAGLPFETSLYVAKITAMAIVAQNPGAFGFGKLTREPTLKSVKVDVPPGASLKEIAEAAGIELDELSALNPHLKRSRVPPGEPLVQLYVPKEAQVRFAQRWSQTRASAPATHVLRLGEGLEELARRSGTTVQKLRELNELANDTRVSAGLALLVPAGAKPTADLVEPLIASVPDQTFHYPDRKRLFYRVAAGDTPSSVARFFDVTADELQSWNHLGEGAALQPGMLLQLFVVPELDVSRAVVYAPDEVRILTVGSHEFFDHHEAQRGRVRVRYRVQPNDTLNELATRFDLSVGSIARINQFPSQRELARGEWITMYVPEAELEKLATAGIVQRIGGAAPVATRDADADELPEAEGEPLLKPNKEGPVAPPRKPRVVAPSKPVKQLDPNATRAPKLAR